MQFTTISSKIMTVINY